MELEILRLIIESGGIAALALFVLYRMFQRFMSYIENHAKHLTEAITELCVYLKKMNGNGS